MDQIFAIAGAAFIFYLLINGIFGPFNTGNGSGSTENKSKSTMSSLKSKLSSKPSNTTPTQPVQSKETSTEGSSSLADKFKKRS